MSKETNPAVRAGPGFPDLDLRGALCLPGLVKIERAEVAGLHWERTPGRLADVAR